MKNLNYQVDYFEHIIKNHRTMSNKSPIQMYSNKSQNRISFRIKTGYYLEPLTPERRITTVKNGKNIW